jgi:uncharacterized hydrophobic protein (TIGR00271 family)
MLVHLRLTVPSALLDEVLGLVTDHDCITNVTRVRDAAVGGEGDLVELDVAREFATEVLDSLHETGLSSAGAILVWSPDSTPFEAAEEIARAAPGDPEDAVIWPQVVERAEGATHGTVSYFTFMVLAVVLAAIAVLTDSPILVVGAMVVGPEFGTVAAVSVGLVLRRWAVAGRAAALLAGGFAVAILVVTGLALIASATPLIDPGMLTEPRPMTSFIYRPDAWSFIVAVVAGMAGVLAMTTNQGNALVGVFISVTTVPAAGNLALGLALRDAQETVGSLEQLGLNLAGMVVAGVFVVLVQRLVWKRLLLLSEALRISR